MNAAWIVASRELDKYGKYIFLDILLFFAKNIFGCKIKDVEKMLFCYL